MDEKVWHGVFPFKGIAWRMAREEEKRKKIIG
jgi:hypothetical protein